MPERSNHFSQFQLKPAVITALSRIGFFEPTPVQAKLIPAILSGQDVVGQSQTGSGKTHTFLIPIFNQLVPDVHQTQVVITTPSRELASQITRAAQQLRDQMGLENVTIAELVGGTDKQRQLHHLEKGQPQIVIGTPGRIKDLVSSQALRLKDVRTLVVDEADMTLDMGFLNEVDYVAAAMPKDLQTLVFSATMPEKLKPFLKKYLHQPRFETIPTTAVIADTIENIDLATKSQDKDRVIQSLLKILNPYLALVFTNTKERAKELAAYLRDQGFKVAEIHGDIPPRERRRVMKAIQNLDYQYVVATDLAARGIDIEGVSHVINDGVPRDEEFFVHRVGRTGRNGMSGTAITLYGPDEEAQINQIEQMGVEFKPMKIQQGQLVPVKGRHARHQRVATTNRLEPNMIGMVKKKKKVVKPGYKRQIKNALKRERQKNNRIAQREARRNTQKKR
ncbi:DEAD/DEAH box helicase [Lactobacillaceae bacterium L1_55_11]|nr:DEAD/DEAH box helicase [Lactobacillaceae bacterium L1_55_11]